MTLLRRISPLLLLAFALVVFLCSQANAGISINAPYYPGYAPPYFSGTACSASAYVTVNNSDGSSALLTRVWFEVNGEQAKSFTYNPPTSGTTASMTFDSTHFADATTITIKVKATDQSGKTVEKSYSAPAYNKVYAL